MNATVEKVARLEAEIANAITHADLGDIYKKIDPMIEKIGHMEGQMVLIISRLEQIYHSMEKRNQ